MLTTSRNSDSRNSDMAVVVYDRALQKAVPKSTNIRVLKHTARTEIENAVNLFVLSSDIDLKLAAEVIHKASSQHRLRALMIHSGSDATWLPQLMNRADVRSLRNTIVHQGTQVPARVLKAWTEGVQDITIANAFVSADLLLIQDCAAQVHEFPFTANRALAKLSPSERGSFRIDPDGNYIHWPSADIHLDMEAIKNTLYKEQRDQAALARLVHDQTFGRAIMIFRKRRNLRQTDMRPLSARQLSRIETSERASVKSIKLIAQGHGLDANEYLNEIAKVMEEIKGQTHERAA